MKHIIHIEVQLYPQSSIPYARILSQVVDFLKSTKAHLVCFQEIVDYNIADPALLGKHVERMWVGECSGSSSSSSSSTSSSNSSADRNGSGGVYAIQDVDLAVHVYQLNEEGPMDEYGPEDENGESAGVGDQVMMAHHWNLPSRELEGVWDNLIFDDQIQTKLLEYVYTTMLFSDNRINPHIISWNRVVLLHGPPGTGKTSLCRGLAQKLSIRLSLRFRHCKLLEINSHSLFSKWFSESGKLVHRLFQQIWSLVNDPNHFVIVLMDEVESLAAARTMALSGNEPSDSIRVVNALLTQMDKLKERSNVLILTTSNITRAIDLAFVDRADIKLLVGLPSQKAIYAILESTVRELQRVGIIRPKCELMDWRRVEVLVATEIPVTTTGLESTVKQSITSGQSSFSLATPTTPAALTLMSASATNSTSSTSPAFKWPESTSMSTSVPGQRSLSSPSLSKINVSSSDRSTDISGIRTESWPSSSAISVRSSTVPFQEQEEDPASLSRKLYIMARHCQGMSARTIRKLPFLAHASFIQVAHTPTFEFLVGLEKAILQEQSARSLMDQQ